MNPIWLTIVLMVVSALISTFVTNYVKQSKLTVAGFGGGSGSWSTMSISVLNAPFFMGLNLGETRIFGKRLIPPIRKGIHIERNRARECRAWIHGPPGNRAMTLLWWQLPDDRRERFVSLDSGDSAYLTVFARAAADPSRYFIYEPESNTSATPKMPPQAAGWQDTMAFSIRIADTYDRQLLKLPITIRKEYDGRFCYYINGATNGF